MVSSVELFGDDDDGFFDDTEGTENAEKLEQLLADTKVRMGMMFELMPIGMALHQEQSIIYANKEMARLLETQPESLIGRHCLDFIEGDILADLVEKFMILFKEGTSFEIPVVEIRDMKGNLRKIQLIVGMMRWEDNHVAQVLMQDISKIKELEKDLEIQKEKKRLLEEQKSAIEKSEVHFRTLFESSRDAIILTTKDRIVDCNTAAVKLFKAKDRQELLSKPKIFYSPEFQEDGSRSLEIGTLKIREVLDKGYSFFDWTHKRINGSEFAAEVFMSSIELDGETVIMASVRDVSKRKKQEKELLRHQNHLQEMVEEATYSLKEKNEEIAENLLIEIENQKAQREFISVVSHEFRTPLTVIDGGAQNIKLFLERGNIEKATSRVEKIRSGVSRLNGMIDDILLSSKLESGTFEMIPSYVDFAKFIEEKCEMMREAHRNHKIECDVTELPHSIWAHPDSIERILENILSNALKYSPKADRIEVTGLSEENYAVLRVRDFGVGIPEGDLDNLFKRYFRAKTSQGIKGTGIGLNLVKTLVDWHKGHIEVESTVGEGTCFTIYLPIYSKDINPVEH
ncbi:putative Histidine kinase [Candidatus Terasakiella magnetica]|uniref:histidine kinase n=1 Tax=Candidatus Terasakiella magnetica TaxID=1867952 RepID=A0A1C3RHV7_9PROT|nr:PAS domain-containing sensor histidine kinase [Candidatus Terasakiella magnetica]SCA56860.1 putative Histidine kinase [Candidatus Terasakiella magnetica]